MLRLAPKLLDFLNPGFLNERSSVGFAHDLPADEAPVRFMVKQTARSFGVKLKKHKGSDSVLADLQLPATTAS